MLSNEIPNCMHEYQLVTSIVVDTIIFRGKKIGVVKESTISCRHCCLLEKTYSKHIFKNKAVFA